MTGRQTTLRFIILEGIPVFATYNSANADVTPAPVTLPRQTMRVADHPEWPALILL